MATSKTGLYGHPNGKIGNIVFYVLNGQNVSRTIGDPGKPSRNQLANRQSMSVTMAFLKPMNDFINASFGLEAAGTVRNAFNLATSYNKKEAIQGEYPNLSVNYSKVILSRGSLPVAKDIKIDKTGAGILISWDPDCSDRSVSHDDRVMIMLYHPLRKKASSFLNAARREEGSRLLKITEEWMNEPIEAYLCFKTADEKQISDSIYIGNLNGEKESSEEKSKKEKYLKLKTRFDQVAADYLRLLYLDSGAHVDTKAFRHLQKEYEVLKAKLDSLPGKPG
ncbi:DUF6266 family protein [Pedobacter steynii]|uniref:Uncharacterized protein n=1 Tax=Pedobacter steynii TaxID=430522 RepID=A0A1D7QHH5_9SPHI|nr:DUF6266 family protein [Pedobacter steynii]AOM78114.1 hypothetical protein BFS30_13600 [Pedobacter steynii]